MDVVVLRDGKLDVVPLGTLVEQVVGSATTRPMVALGASRAENFTVRIDVSAPVHYRLNNTHANQPGKLVLDSPSFQHYLRERPLPPEQRTFRFAASYTEIGLEGVGAWELALPEEAGEFGLITWLNTDEKPVLRGRGTLVVVTRLFANQYRFACAWNPEKAL